MFVFASKRTDSASLLFKSLSDRPNEEWLFVTEKDFFKNLITKDITKIFFYHWNHMVPQSVYRKYECINLHTSNLPDGKGGSPIQNQIMDDVIVTKVNALQISDDGLDAGPTYCAQEVTLQGSLSDIWQMISRISYKLISRIIEEDLSSCPQPSGDYVVYKRRKDNAIPFGETDSLKHVYDFIRMLDDETYPSPYLNVGGFKLEFNRSHFNGEKIHADVIITKP